MLLGNNKSRSQRCKRIKRCFASCFIKLLISYWWFSIVKKIRWIVCFSLLIKNTYFLGRQLDFKHSGTVFRVYHKPKHKFLLQQFLFFNICKQNFD
jgi:hypothetical protein